MVMSVAGDHGVSVDEDDRPAWWEWTLAGVAALNAVLATIWLIGGTGDPASGAGVGILLAGVTVAPLIFRDRREFRIACRVSVAILAVLGPPLVFSCSFLFIPGMALLLLAGFASRRWSLNWVWVPTLALLVVADVAPWSAAIWQSVLN
jgi:hypothetical protein